MWAGPSISGGAVKSHAVVVRMRRFPYEVEVPSVVREDSPLSLLWIEREEEVEGLCAHDDELRARLGVECPDHAGEVLLEEDLIRRCPRCRLGSDDPTDGAPRGAQRDDARRGPD